jgi:hypothetical protein
LLTEMLLWHILCLDHQLLAYHSRVSSIWEAFNESYYYYFFVFRNFVLTITRTVNCLFGHTADGISRCIRTEKHCSYGYDTSMSHDTTQLFNIHVQNCAKRESLKFQLEATGIKANVERYKWAAIRPNKQDENNGNFSLCSDIIVRHSTQI